MKKAEKTEITRARIIKAAMQEFGKNGYESSTLNAICKDYEISKGLLYHNFRGKEELYLICVGRCFKDITEYLKTQEIQGDFQSYMEARFRYFSENPLYTRIFFEAVLQPPAKLREKIEPLKKEFNRLNESVYRSILSNMTLREGITEKQALEYYEIMQNMFNGYFSSQIFLNNNFSVVVEAHEKHLAKILDYMLYGIAKKGEKIMLFVRLLLAVVIALLVGKLVSKLKLPSILGWLITGMILGPHALKLVNETLLNSVVYESAVHILECAVGLMIGTELVWSNIKKSGKAIVITTLTQSLGTFVFVSLVFGVVFWITDTPLYLAVIFGGIALATAPAPALSIVREFKASGPVTETLIPMAALDDIVGCVVFFTTIAVVAGNLSAGELPAYMIALVVLLPLVLGVVTGLVGGVILKKEREAVPTLVLVILTVLMTSAVGFWCNSLLPRPVLNFMLLGMAFSATFANMVSEDRLAQIMGSFSPILGIAMVIVILNLGAPLDYHLILGAGLFTAIYIIARGLGKYFGAFFGAAVTKSPDTVRKYLGFTLLPHSGVSLVFTGIAVSVLNGPAPECAQIIQGTIAAAAVINEIIAVIMAKKGFEWAGELRFSNKK